MAKENIQEAIELLTQTRDALYDSLQSESQMLALSVKTGLNQLINRLARTTGANVNTHQTPVFEPVTNFLGDTVKTAKPVTKADLSAKELERKIFADKVSKLQANFDELSNEEINESWVKIEPNVVRGVAKRAGLPDFKEAELTDEYLDSIRDALEQNAEVLESNKDQEQMIANSTAGSARDADKDNDEEEEA